MAKRSRFITIEDGTVEASGSKYNGKYILGNLLICGDCGASYRRRTERGKVVWRCATRIEKGKNTCPHSPTLDEGWVQDTLGQPICRGGVYDENTIRNEVDKIQVFNKHFMICYKDTSESENGSIFITVVSKTKIEHIVHIRE